MHVNLNRFIIEQNNFDSIKPLLLSNYERALQEIDNGYKTSHWICYIFLQVPFGLTKNQIIFQLNQLMRQSHI